MTKNRGYPHEMTDVQKRRYGDMQLAETYPGGLDIHAGDELGFRSEGEKVLPGADKPRTFGVGTLREDRKTRGV